MKMVIISPDGFREEFRYDQFAEFHNWLFAVMCGIPKKVTILCDESVGFNVVYKIEYA